MVASSSPLLQVAKKELHCLIMPFCPKLFELKGNQVKNNPIQQEFFQLAFEKMFM